MLRQSITICWKAVSTDKGSDGGDRVEAIDMLEADNFELRDLITRLKLHNATLARMIKYRTNKPSMETWARHN